MTLRSVTGFATPLAQLIHHGKHNDRDFRPGDTPEQYEARAIAFMESPMVGTRIQECIDSEGDILRYNPETEEFGVISPTFELRTYFKPMPASVAPADWPSDKTHHCANNLAYFLRECK